MMLRAIGLVELNSIDGDMETADSMLKAAQVEAIFCRTVCPGKYIIFIGGGGGRRHYCR
jgi:microcompartment protein CcmL/EutN